MDFFWVLKYLSQFFPFLKIKTFLIRKYFEIPPTPQPPPLKLGHAFVLIYEHYIPPTTNMFQGQFQYKKDRKCETVKMAKKKTAKGALKTDEMAPE